VKPYVLEILQAIFCNESIPLGLGVTPTETSASYRRIYDHLVEILGDGGDELLKSIPFLSDQGQALAAFVREVGLIWLNCHRHLIEKGGAGCLTGDWIRRLLKCGDLTEARQVAALIEAEMAAVSTFGEIRSKNGVSRYLLLGMIQAVKAANDDSLILWARWLRLLCPTTTNAAEAVHAVLNRRVAKTRRFVQRLAKVKECLWSRFERRDSPDRLRQRAINRFVKKQPYQRLSAGNVTFYEQLYTTRDTHERVQPSWKFGDVELPTAFPAPEWIQIFEQLPPTWQVAPSEQRAPEPPIENPSEGEGIEEAPPIQAESPAYLSAGMGIIQTIINLHRNELAWKKGSTMKDLLASDVWGVGAELELRNCESLSIEQVVAWRMEIYKKYDARP
jgi:hypothetical protein